MDTAASRIDERPDLPQTTNRYPERRPGGPPALEVRASYNGVLIGTRFLLDIAPKRRLLAGHGPDRQTSYTIGRSAWADAPAAGDLLGHPDLPLVSKWGGGFLVNVTPRMTGDVMVGGKVYRLADYLADRGNNFTLPADARARIDCGAMTFQLSHTTRAEPLPRRWFTWRWDEQRFTLGSFLALGLFLLMIFAVPPEGTSLSGDLTGMGRTFVPFTIQAPEPDKVPAFLSQRTDEDQGQSGKAHLGDSGRLGDKNAKRPSGLYAIKGDGKDKHLGKEEAKSAILNKGILGILGASRDAPFNSIFGHGIAAGDGQQTVLGNLVGGEIASAYSASGLGVTGTGWWGGGTGIGTLGTGNLNTSLGRNYGRGAGIGLPSRKAARVAGVTPGIVTTRGSLDKEIIRRVVHLHMNEVKYCYDQELVRKAGLEGRVAVQFVISPMGQVLSSVMQSTTMNNLRVEKCVVDAIKRWEFPKPTGGGIAIVSYPFNFVAGSGG